MRLLLVLLFFILLQNCTKPKTVLICGDHICVNKAEAEQYFEDNLTIEVQIINKPKEQTLNLVELNLQKNSIDKTNISIESKIQTNKEIKILNNDEIKKIKKEIALKRKNKFNTKKEEKKVDIITNKITKKKQVKEIKEKKNLSKKENKFLNSEALNNTKKSDNNANNQIPDICLIIKKCTIDEISAYLLKQNKMKGFPDITTKN
jgi:hypothetical protein